MDRCIVFVCQDPGNPIPAASFALDKNGDGFLAYGVRYLDRDAAFSLDPLHLPLSHDTRKIPRHKDGSYGVLTDAGPNTWGVRLTSSLMRANHRALPVTPVDWLLQSWHYGAGCLGFSERPDQPPRPGVAPAPLQQLTKRVVEVIEALSTIVDTEIDEEVQRLVFPGGSLGGVRPKTVVMHEGVEHIAKFSRMDDAFDVPTVEYATLRLALKAGITVPDFELVTIGGRSVLLVARFDRTAAGRRVHYISANTLINIDTLSGDRREYKTKYSYAGIAESMRRINDEAVADSQQLFRRMVFNILVGNVDDHMRNHALIMTERDKYRLSPAFDILPHLQSTSAPQSIGVGALGAASTIANAMSQHERFFLNNREARHIVDEVRAVVAAWRTVFREEGVSERDMHLLGPCFDAADEAEQMSAAVRLPPGPTDV